MIMTALNHRQWQPGMKLMDRYGYFCTLLAPTWNGYAWVIYELLREQGSEDRPVTMQVEKLEPAYARCETHPSCH